ncbi:hypothetical protein GKG47_20140 [Lactonifactor sp. BIOML-A3]|uniref:hypothetical protein n=1 Tax=unclassified Lactonifactor TaxID=2636670 RepID=UPI0012AF2116|nr:MULTISPECIES: hypothetical protein [unclassified Lactonifactor]MSA03717.1 hypothetical protein [Lactonifactor sp. BIOML-A5]MSA10174.1 hypothetical protein [Lactonifactor sp. BIOML-A4]MSA14724.1 hypothetical protein [Lactonifactor sp. BIOML-A3]MSA19146.1 hypothetical protein [Lactonifactor sp. BIOML-A2]MSA39820.1 hypothetical protein [Lactonifactor sp. BIOML-A1]
MKKCKRILCFLIAALLAVMNFSLVYASEGGGGSSGGAGASSAIDYGLAQMGVTASPEIREQIRNSDYMQKYSEGVSYKEVEKDGKKYIQFDSAYWGDLHNAALDAMRNSAGCSMGVSSGIFPNGKLCTPESFLEMWTTITPSQYATLLSFLKGKNVLFMKDYSTWYFYILDTSKYYYSHYASSSSSYIQAYDPVTNSTFSYGDLYSINFKEATCYLGPFSHNYKNFNNNNVSYYYLPTLKIFSSPAKVNSYINKSSMYAIDNFYNFDVNAQYSISKNMFETNNWETVQNTTYNSVTNNISEVNSNASITPDELQGIVDAGIGKILEALDSINDNLDDVVQNLDDLLSAITASGNNQVAWLAKIYNLLAERLDGSGGSGGDIAFPPDLSEKLDAILAELVLSNTKLDSIIDNMSDLEDAIEQSGGANNFLLGLFNKFKDVGKEAQQRFPTSIPWDLMIVLKKLAATPETPKFDFAIKIERYGIDVPLTLDLEQFAPLSKASRALLSLTFVLFLMTMTRKLFLDGGGAKNVG